MIAITSITLKKMKIMTKKLRLLPTLLLLLLLYALIVLTIRPKNGIPIQLEYR